MARMNIAELEAHIAKLGVEGGHIQKRIERLQAMQAPNAEQLKLLQEQLVRLETLITLAQDHLKEKNERKGQWDMGQRPQRPFGGHFGTGGGGGGGGSRYSGGGGRGGPSRGRPRW
jgi:uncharacterized membrane protein YgcG